MKALKLRNYSFIFCNESQRLLSSLLLSNIIFADRFAEEIFVALIYRVS